MERPGLYQINIFVKVLFSLLLSYLVMLSGCSNTTSPSEDVFLLKFYPSTVEIGVKNETAVDVIVDDAKYLISAYFTISFNPSLVEVTNIKTSGEGFIITDAGANVITSNSEYNNETGKIIIGVLAQKENFFGVNGNGILAIITFRGKTAGSDNLNFVNSRPNDIIMGEFSDDYEHGWVEVIVETQNGTINVL